MPELEQNTTENTVETTVDVGNESSAATTSAPADTTLPTQATTEDTIPAENANVGNEVETAAEDADAAPSADQGSVGVANDNASLFAKIHAIAERISVNIELETLEDIEDAFEAIVGRATALGANVNDEIAAIKEAHNL